MRYQSYHYQFWQEIQPKTRFRQTLWIVGLVVVIAFMEQVGWVRPVRQLNEAVIAPLQTMGRGTVSAATLPYRVGRDSFRTHRIIQDLQLRYQEASAELTELEALRAENEALRAILENTDRRTEHRVIAAPIISYGTPFINHGQADGIAVDSLVFVHQTLVGRIAAVTPHQAEIRLLSHPNSDPILAQTQTGVTGVLTGNGRAVLLTEIPSDAQVEVGQRVVTTGQRGIEPDLYVGRITQVRYEPSDPVKEAVVEPGINFYQARVVEVSLE